MESRQWNGGNVVSLTNNCGKGVFVFVKTRTAAMVWIKSELFSTTARYCPEATARRSAAAGRSDQMNSRNGSKAMMTDLYSSNRR